MPRQRKIKTYSEKMIDRNNDEIARIAAEINGVEAQKANTTDTARKNNLQSIIDNKKERQAKLRYDNARFRNNRP